MCNRSRLLVVVVDERHAMIYRVFICSDWESEMYEKRKEIRQLFGTGTIYSGIIPLNKIYNLFQR